MASPASDETQSSRRRGDLLFFGGALIGLGLFACGAVLFLADDLSAKAKILDPGQIVVIAVILIAFSVGAALLEVGHMLDLPMPFRRRARGARSDGPSTPTRAAAPTGVTEGAVPDEQSTPVSSDEPPEELPVDEVPEVEVPEVEVPEVEVPEVEVPEAEVPEAEVPEAEVPEVEEAAVEDTAVEGPRPPDVAPAEASAEPEPAPVADAVPLVPPGIHALGYVALSVSDRDRSLAWYSGLLGFQEAFRQDSASRRVSVLRFGPGGYSIALVERPATGERPFDATQQGLDHLAFAVHSREELLDWEQRLTAAGVAHSAVVDIPPGAILNLVDPDGISLALFWDSTAATPPR